MKKLIRSILNKFSIEIKRKNPELKNNLSFDDIYKIKINKNPIIFDVGANKGQSIERFKKIFPNAEIHSFEPNKDEFINLKNKYQSDNTITINNFGVGDLLEKKNLYITAKSGSSSFNKLNPNSEWLKKRSKQFNTSNDGYTKSIETVNIITLDEYCKKNNLNNIDILKIDTQGYEDKVLKGCENIFKNNVVSFVEAEIMFDDVYEKYLTFSDLEKNLLPYDFRFCAISTANNNLFEGLVFFADLVYFNKNKIYINK